MCHPEKTCHPEIGGTFGEKLAILWGEVAGFAIFGKLENEKLGGRWQVFATYRSYARAHKKAMLKLEKPATHGC